MDCSLPGSSVHGIFQARVLEWVAIAFSDTRWDPGYWNFSTLHATWPHKTPKKETRLPKAVFWFPPDNNVTLGKLVISRSLGFLIYKPDLYVKKLRCHKFKSVFQILDMFQGEYGERWDQRGRELTKGGKKKSHFLRSLSIIPQILCPIEDSLLLTSLYVSVKSYQPLNTFSVFKFFPEPHVLSKGSSSGWRLSSHSEGRVASFWGGPASDFGWGKKGRGDPGVHYRCSEQLPAQLESIQASQKVSGGTLLWKVSLS